MTNISCLMTVIGLVLVMIADKAHVSEPTVHPGLLVSIYAPLLDSDGGLQIGQVPALVYGAPPDSFIDAICSPVSPASGDAKMRARDINAITTSGVKVNVDATAQDIVLQIDVSKAMLPERAKFCLVDVVEAFLACLRFQIPPGSLTRDVVVRVSGASEPSQFEKVQGRLWKGRGDPKN